MIRLKSDCDFDINHMIDPDARKSSLAELFGDLEKLVNCLFCACEEQAISKQVNEMEFAKGLMGDTLDEAVKAFLEAIADFFPNPHQRKTLKKFFETATKANEALMGMEAEKAEEMLTGIEKQIAASCTFN